jgi:predicted TIM-barrel fold metal-dependent hydrolase
VIFLFDLSNYQSPFEPDVLNHLNGLNVLNKFFSDVAGEDSLMIGSDYTHRDSSMEYEFPRLLKERAEKGEITQSAVQKILYDNAKTFYGL